jgi:nucleoside-diphosphate-sugar epimerase
VRVLITGASGFIGAPLTAALADAGYQVRAAVRDRPRRSFPAGVAIAVLPDLAGTVDWAPLVAGMDALVHLAGIAHVGPEIPDAIYDRVNHLATTALAGAAASSRRAQIRVHVVDPRAGRRFGRCTPYRGGRAAPDRRLRPLQARRGGGRSRIGLSYTILRPALVYGPNPKGNLASLMRLAALPVPLPFGAFRTAARCWRSTT